MTSELGLKALHAIITPVCRANRTDMGAFDEAVERARKTYLSCLKGRGEDGAKYHLLLFVEPKDVSDLV